jgi:site-specific recombinase XerD
MHYLRNWFRDFAVKDDTHSDGERQLLVWEAMEPVVGRRRIRRYSFDLVARGLKPHTRRGYLGALRRLFDYVLEDPYIQNGAATQSIASKYGTIEQPVSKYEYPLHILDNEIEGFVLTGDELVDFYEFVRSVYLPRSGYSVTSMRAYAMIVLAGESGLRADELRNLNARGEHRDLFYERGMIQTRCGKGAKGSGKRARKTVFTEVAQEALRAYEDHVRPKFKKADTNPALFLSTRGCRVSYHAMYTDLSCVIRAARADGLDLPPHFSWHSLRGSFATNYVERHGNKKRVLLELIDLMGHLNLGTLHRYLKHNRAYNEMVLEEFHSRLLPEPTSAEGGTQCPLSGT